jgi:hypothetical protein
MFQDAAEVKPETLIVSSNDDFSQCELYTAAELSAYYADPNAAGAVSEVPPYSLVDGAGLYPYEAVREAYLLPKVQHLYA